MARPKRTRTSAIGRAPTDPVVARRRMIVDESGLTHAMIAKQMRDVTRGGVSGVIGGWFPSRRVAEGICQVLRARFLALAADAAFPEADRRRFAARAEDCTLAGLGFDTERLAG